MPTTRYYSNGTQQAGQAWRPCAITGIIANPTYRGVNVAKKREIIELLVQGIRIDGKGARGWEAAITYYFRPGRVAEYNVL